MAADLAYRMVRLNPDLGAMAALETPGIVLIDEVDMHLHPSWQEDQLTQVFCSAPGARFEVEAWDVYHDGKYLYTEYNIRGT